MRPGLPRVRDDIAVRPGYHSPQLDVAVRLNTNESPVPPPSGFAEALHERLDGIDWNRYPDRSAGRLRDMIAHRYSRSAEEVFVANGSNEVLQTLLLAFGGPGRKALTFEPTYAMHAQIARNVSTEVVEVARYDDLSIDLELVMTAVDAQRPDVVFLCSPNNPTGVSDAPSLVAEVLQAVRGREILVIADEAYGQFARSSSVRLIDEDTPLVVSRTFSKTWAMAAARVGYVLGPSWVVAELDKVVLPYHLDSFKQAVAETALLFGDEMDARVAELVDQRRWLQHELGSLDVDVWPSEANYILFRPRGLDGQTLWQRLVDHSVLVRNCATWPGLADCLRVTVGTESENQAFVTALKAALSPT